MIEVSQEIEDVAVVVIRQKDFCTTADDSASFETIVSQCIENGFKKIVIDLGELERINSVGLGVFLSLKGKKGLQFKIAAANAKIKTLFSVRQFNHYFNCYDTVQSAVEAF